MKIESVHTNHRKKAFDLVADGRSFSYPFAELDLQPDSDDRIAEASPDIDFGNEAFTYRLESGREDSIHIERVLEYCRDPSYYLAILVHRLTVEAQRAVKNTGLSKRELIRRLGTSASQFYRLLDPTNSTKSIGQLMELLHVAGWDVEITVKPGRTMGRPRAQRNRRGARRVG